MGKTDVDQWSGQLAQFAGQRDVRGLRAPGGVHGGARRLHGAHRPEARPPAADRPPTTRSTARLGEDGSSSSQEGYARRHVGARARTGSSSDQSPSSST
jgi:hypothetical protein